MQNGPENAPQPGVWPHAASHATTSSPDDGTLRIDFVGKRGALFWLALRMGFYTILTLGFYRFWMKSRLRRWYWSSIRIGGHPMEYVGDPIEKLLGFLIAVVILTFYIGVINLVLMFASFSLFEGNFAGYLLSFVGVIPLWFYATYRARRYVLGRTRWRGVRFGLEKGAWGYTWRALVHWAITLCSAGLLWPRMTFWLEKYKTDRTFFGSVRLVQGGRWFDLYRAAIPFAVSLVLLVLLVLWILVLDPIRPLDEWNNTLSPTDDFARIIGGQAPERLWLVPLLVIALIYGATHYVVVAHRIMVGNKSANGVRLVANWRPKRVFGIYLLGYFISYLSLVLGIIGVLLLAIFVFGLTSIGTMTGIEGLQNDAQVPRWLGFILVGIGYFAVFLAWSVLNHVFVTLPKTRHYAITTGLVNAAGLDQVSQRKRDELAQAEGFAEALDLGAAI